MITIEELKKRKNELGALGKPAGFEEVIEDMRKNFIIEKAGIKESELEFFKKKLEVVSLEDVMGKMDEALKKAQESWGVNAPEKLQEAIKAFLASNSPYKSLLEAIPLLPKEDPTIFINSYWE